MTDQIGPWPVIYFEISSIDSWKRQHVEGYTSVIVPATPGEALVEIAESEKPGVNRTYMGLCKKEIYRRLHGDPVANVKELLWKPEIMCSSCCHECACSSLLCSCTWGNRNASSTSLSSTRYCS